MHQNCSLNRISLKAIMKDLTKILFSIRPVEPPAELFGHIILAIEKKQARKTFYVFLPVSIISLIVMPISGIILANQIQDSGILYLISTAFGNFGAFRTFWQDFSLAFLESLPLTGMIIFLISLIISIFTLKLFFYRKKLLLNYLKPGRWIANRLFL